MPGAVFLVGAGPGPTDLVTERALELLAQADVVVYDALAPQQLLARTKSDCVLLNAGKRAGDHVLSQDETNALLVREAQAGNLVVRLKGGDPFVFGRGGEEADACRKGGVHFEYVPGVTSAVAVPGYAGIPVTMRGISELFTVVTGHRKEDAPETDLDWRWLARSPGTLVFLMGLGAAKTICDSLIGSGMLGTTPAAVISRGGYPDQQVFTGTVRTLPSIIKEYQPATPAIIVIGEVVRKRQDLKWFEKRPLFGVCVVVTRARADSSQLAANLRELGASVVECPTIRIERLPSIPLDQSIASIDRFSYLIFTSRYGVHAFFDRMAAADRDARSLAHAGICAVGTATAQALNDNGVIADIVPGVGERTAQGLLKMLGGEPLYGQEVLYVAAENPAGNLAAGLEELGARTTVIPAYRNVREAVDEAVRDQAQVAEYVLFASASSARNYAEAVGVHPTGVGPQAITIGPVSTEAAQQLGFEVLAEARDPSISGLVTAVMEAHGRQQLARQKPSALSNES